MKLTKLDQEKLTRTYYKTFYEGDNIDELKKVKLRASTRRPV